MLCVAVLVVFLLCQSSADPIAVKYRCNETAIGSDVSYTRFYPSLDGVLGRYTAELCTFNNPNWTRLTMDLSYNEKLKVCDPEFRRTYRWPIKPGPQHSSNNVAIAGLANCSHVCYAMDFDLIFSSCYLLQTTMYSGSRSYSPHDSYYQVNNSLTIDYFNKTLPYVVLFKYDDYVTLQWMLGIPAVDYNVTLHKINNDTGVFLHEDSEVTQNCTVWEDDVKVLRCILSPPYGCYQASLEHGGLWTAGIFHNKKIVTYDHLCYLPVKPPELRPRSAALWWACGALLLCACALLAGMGLRRHLWLRDYHKRVLDFWFNNRSSEAESGAAVTRDSRDVLLLYAREGEHGQQAVAALRDLIQHSTGGTVYDLFCPATLALCGAAPATWLRELLARAHVRVLLLQAPALAVLYRDQLREDEAGLTLREPLLGRRAMYRAPHFGDQLLKMALRQIAETVDMHQDYHKYYFATYQGLETDVVPQVVAYRRYVLPDAARALAHDLAAVAGPDAAHDALRRAVQAHVLHAQLHPDYLMDEIFIN